MGNKYNASLIIPTYNKLNYLKLTLYSILQLKNMQDVQIIIVNDGSEDGTKEYLNKFKYKENYKIVHVENGGRSFARNVGALYAEADILIFVDDDVLVDKGFVDYHLNNHRNKNRVVHGLIKEMPYLRAFSNPSFPHAIDGRVHLNMEKYLINEEIIANHFAAIRKQGRIGKFERDILELCSRREYSNYHWISSIGANLSISKDTFFMIGEFDNQLGREWGCEDLEFGYRGMLSGVNFAVEEQALLYHMSHYRANSLITHQKAMNYFFHKYEAEHLLILNDYFTGSIKSLIEWADMCNERSDNL